MENATDCAIVQSSIYLTSNTGHEYETRLQALSLLNHQLERGSYEQGTILHTSYLGPDLSKLPDIFGDKEAQGNADKSSLNDGGSSNNSSNGHPVSYYTAIGVLSLTGCALALYLVMLLRVRRERRRVALAAVSNVAVQSSHRSSSDIVTVDDLLYSPPSRSSGRKSMPLESQFTMR